MEIMKLSSKKPIEKKPFKENNQQLTNQEKDEIEEKKESGLVKFLDFLTKFSIFAIFLGLPVFYTKLTLQGGAFEKEIYFYFWVLLALISWASKCGYLGEMKIRRTPLDIPIIIFWLFYLLTTIFSVDSWHSFAGFFGDPSRGFLNVTALVVVFYLITTNFSWKFLYWVLGGFLTSVIISIAWTLLSIFGLNSLGNGLPISLSGRLEEMVVFLSGALLAFLTFIIALGNKENSSSGKKFLVYLGIFFIAVTLFSLFALYNYVIWIAVLAGVTIFLIFILSKIIRAKGAWTLLPMVVFVIILIFLMIGPVGISKIQLPLSFSVPYNASFEIAKGSLTDNFFLGYGPANYGYAFSKHLPEGFDNLGVRFFQGRGLILESISTLGAIGTVVLFIIVLTFLSISIFLLSKDKEKNKIYSLGLFSVAFVFMISLFLRKMGASVFIFSGLFVSLSVATIYAESKIEKNFLPISLRASSKFALTLAFIYLLIFASVAFFFVFLGKTYIADIHARKAVVERVPGEENSVDELYKAIRLNPREGRYFSILGQEYMRLANENILKSEQERDIEKIRNYINLAKEAADRGAELMPNDVTAVEVTAAIYRNSGNYFVEDLEKAQEKYQRAIELEPGDPRHYLNIGVIKEMQSQKVSEEDEIKKKNLLSSAEEWMKKSVGKRRNYDEGYYNLALVQSNLGKQDEAIGNMANAVILKRDNLNYVFNLARLYQNRGQDDDAKIAESLYRQILGVNSKELNARLSLAMLLEKDPTRRNEALDQYEEVLALLPENSVEARAQIEEMIERIKGGQESTPQVQQSEENLQIESNEEVQNEPEEQEQSPITEFPVETNN